MNRIVSAAQESSRLMNDFSRQLASANIERAQALPLMTATSLILAGTSHASSNELLAPGFDAVRASLGARFESLRTLATSRPADG